MALNQLSGIPWHVGKFTRKAGDEKRHRGNCQFYKNQFCLKLQRRCHGSAHCGLYRRFDKNYQEELPSFRSIIEKQFHRGKLLVHPKFGAGLIQDLTDDKVVVAFRSGKVVTFDLQFCIDKDIFDFIQ